MCGNFSFSNFLYLKKREIFNFSSNRFRKILVSYQTFFRLCKFKKVKSKNLPLIMVFQENFCIEDDRQSVLMSKSQSYFVLIGPAKKKNENRSTDKVLTAKMNFELPTIRSFDAYIYTLECCYMYVYKCIELSVYMCVSRNF